MTVQFSNQEWLDLFCLKFLILNDSLLPIKIDSLRKSRTHICEMILDKVMRKM
jgi:hypothetical protein